MPSNSTSPLVASCRRMSVRPDGRLARARLAHEAQRLALGQLEAHVLHRRHRALAEEALLEEERLVERPSPRG